MQKEFIRNFLDVEVDGFNYTVRYIIRAMYNVVDAEGFSTLKQEIIEDVTMTDKEIEEAGGTSKVLASFKERFAPLCCN